MDRTTPPLSRNNSSSNLEDSADSDTEGLGVGSQKNKTNTPTDNKSLSGTPSTSNRTLKRTATWSMGYMPSDKGQVSSTDPLISPRSGASEQTNVKKSDRTEKRAQPDSGQLPLPKPHSFVPSTSKLSDMTGISNAYGATRTPALTSSSNTSLGKSATSDKEIKSYLIDEVINKPQGAVLKSGVLARQVVYALSKGYTIKLEGSMIDSIFRSVVWLRPKISDDEKTPPPEANLIKRFVEPFMHYHFRAEKFDKCLDLVVSNYHPMKDEASKLYGRNAYEFGKSGDAEKLMKPVIQPVLSYVCGAESNVKSSGMAVPVINFLLSLVEEFKVWDDINGSGNADILKTAQKKAVIGCFGTRSFMPDFDSRLNDMVNESKEKKDNKYDGEYFRPLTKFMNTYLNTKVNDFLETIVECPLGERKKIRKMAEISESHQTFESESVKEDHLEKTKKKVLARKPTLKTQILDVFGAGVSASTSSALSPRSAEKRNLKEVDATSYNEFKSKKRLPEKPIDQVGGRLDADNDADFKLKQEKKKKRTKYLIEFNKEFLIQAFGEKLKSGSREGIANIPGEKDFPEWPKILRDFTKKVVEGNDENYSDFKQEPYEYWSNFLVEFIRSQRGLGNASSPSLERLLAVAKNSGNDV